MTKVAFPTDEHYPFQDDRAVELAQKIVHDFKPDILIRGSDGLDFYSISKYEKSKKVFKGGLEDEIDAWKAGERSWADVAPDAKKPYIVGNHEDRLRKYILAKAKELEGILDTEIQNVLRFNEFGIRLAYNNEVIVDKMLLIKHGSIVRKYSAYTAKAELEKEKYGITVWTGHTHRMGVHYATTRRDVVAAYECGCLCSLNPAYATNPDWQHGVTLGETFPYGVVTEQVQFFQKGKHYFARWRGKEYKA